MRRGRCTFAAYLLWQVLAVHYDVPIVFEVVPGSAAVCSDICTVLCSFLHFWHRFQFKQTLDRWNTADMADFISRPLLLDVVRRSRTMDRQAHVECPLMQEIQRK